MDRPFFAREYARFGILMRHLIAVSRIHQPSAELFQVFDRLLLLRKGGQTVYFGDIGDKCSIMLNYFERNGAPQCDANANP
jgi:ABC-type multidrug transport system ATPase subunit